MFKKIFKLKKNNKNIILKPLSINKVNRNYFKWFKDKEVNRFIKFKPKNIEELRKNVNKILSDKNIFFYSIEVNKSHIGNIKVDNIDFVNKQATLGILIGDNKFRNQGIGYIAINSMLNFFSEKNITHIYLGCDNKNYAALNLYLKCGFKIIKKNKNNLILLYNFFSNKFILGAVQFNSIYGITNFKKKKISRKEEIKILKFAFKNGIDEIDTSEDYNFNISKNREYLNEILINSKVSTDTKDNTYLKLKKKFLNYKKKKLNINIIFIHDGDRLFSVKGKKLLSVLKKLKKNEIIKKIGISIYDYEVLKKLKKQNCIDVIQLPFNLIDNRFCIFKKKIIDLKIKVQVRSIFLQGSMLTRVKSNKDLSKMYDHLKIFAKKHNQSIYEICLNHALSEKYIDKIVIGIRSLSQMKKLFDLKIQNKKYQFKLENSLKKKIINPSKWS